MCVCAYVQDSSCKYKQLEELNGSEYPEALWFHLRLNCIPRCKCNLPCIHITQITNGSMIIFCNHFVWRSKDIQAAVSCWPAILIVWRSLASMESCENLWGVFYDIVLTDFDLLMPVKEIRVDTADAPYMNQRVNWDFKQWGKRRWRQRTIVNTITVPCNASGWPPARS